MSDLTANQNPAAVSTENLTKIYGKAEAAVTALDHIDMRIEVGEFVAVMGPSGCGKSTLLHLVGGLDQPTEGRVFLNGADLSALDDEAISILRRRNIGFVFQFYNLLPVLSALENAALPLLLDGVESGRARKTAAEWLQRFELEDRLQHRPDQLSGGQQQRVAIARALVAEPSLVLADEPTGNLDSQAGDQIAALLGRVSSEWGRTVLIATHDPRIAAQADRILFLKDGKLVDETVLEPTDGRNTEAVADRIRRMGG
ncbi:MAG TPA: ABC transporter ATP-binding protein [Anaerolineales bacterium]|nr:ABC transporter ATP-binding protein [Anaerolineales bacterium]